MRAAAGRAFQESAYVPCSGMSTVWLLRMVFILQTTTTSCRPGGKAPPYTAPFPPRTLRPATTEPRELPTLCRRRYSHPCPHAGPTPGPREAAASAPFPTAGPGPGPEQGGAGGGDVGEGAIPAASPLRSRSERRGDAAAAPGSRSQPGGARRGPSAADGVGCGLRPAAHLAAGSAERGGA